MEFTAYDASNAIIYQSGTVAPNVGVTTSTDPDLWAMRDCIFDDTGKEVHMFWEAASYETNALPALTTFDITSPEFYKGHKFKMFPISGGTVPMPDRITLRVRVEAVGYDVLDNLIASGDLDPAVRNVFTVLDVGTPLQWTKAVDLLPTNTHTYLDRVTGQRVFCATNTNLNVNADRFPAITRTKCSP